MTQRPKQQWFSRCLVCSCTITNLGSGKPKGLCSRPCKLARMRDISKKRYAQQPRKAHIAAPGLMSTKPQTLIRQKNIVAAEKQKRGKCAYHLQNFGCELLVSHDLLAVFEFDHVDPKRKHQPSKKRGGGVARMIGRVTDEVLRAEMAKCELTCCNCHRLKTIANRDWVAIDTVKATSEQLDLQFK